MSEERRSGSLRRRINRLSKRDITPGGIFAAVLAAVGVAAGQLSTGWPDSLLRWILLLVGSAAAGAGVSTELARYLWDRVKSFLDWIPTVRLRRALLILLALVLAVVAGRAIAVFGPRLLHGIRIETSGCPHPAQLTILTTPEGLQSAREIARSYESHTARENFGCAEAEIYVYPAVPEEAQQAVASGWAEDRLTTLGPRPDLWLPGSTDYTVEPATTHGALAEVDSVSVASTPIVLAVPGSLLGDDVRVSRTGVTWSKALEQVWRRQWAVARPDPAGSLVGRLATMAIYDSLARENGSPLTVTEARVLESRLDAALDDFGYPLGGELDLLCRHLREPEPRAAVIVTEHQMRRFNHELVLGGACAVLPSPAHINRMEGIYPTGTRGLDYPVIRLGWTDSSIDQRRQAREFSRWLTTAGGRAALFDAGLRPHGYSGGLPGVVFDPAPPAEEALATVIDLHEQATRPGRVLLALDASGSMRAAAGGRSRLDVAKQGISTTLALLGQDNELGLWVFRGSGRRELVPLGPGERQSDLVKQALPGVTAGGDTPLYDTILAGVTTLAATDDQAVKAMVVLSDGEDSGSTATAGDVVKAASEAGVRVFVIAVGEASCSSRALVDITGKSAGSCRQVTFDALEEQLSEIFTLLWKGA